MRTRHARYMQAFYGWPVNAFFFSDLTSNVFQRHLKHGKIRDNVIAIVEVYAQPQAR